MFDILKPNKLGTKIILLITLLTILSLAVVAVVFVFTEQKKITEYHLTNGKTFAEFITPSIYSNYVSLPTSGQLMFLDLIKQQLSKNPDIVDVMMISKTGKIFFDTDDSARGVAIGRNETSDKYVTDETVLKMITYDAITHRDIVLPDGSDGVEIVVPVAEGSGGHIFSMKFLLSFSSLNKQFREVYMYVGIILIPILLIIFISSVVFSSGITKSLKKLTFATGEIQKGNLNITITPDSKDEIGTLAQSFDTMAKALKKSNEEVMAYQKTIEAKVEERTKQLNESKKELEIKLNEVERLNKLMVDRELKMIELKKEISDLRNKISPTV